MRPSFGGGGRGMAGGGNMLRAIGKAVTRTGVGIQEPFPSSPNSAAAATSSPTSPRTASGHAHNLSSKNQLSISSSAPSSPFTVPLSSPSPSPSPLRQYDDYEWVSADGSEDERRSVYCDDFFLRPVPSTDEVHTAVSAIQEVFQTTTYPQFIRDRFGPNSDLDKDISSPGFLHRASSTGSDLDWIEPAIHLSNSRMLQTYGSERVFDAFHMLQNDPSIQRMVVSLSTDRAVWDAVLNNEAVKELRESCLRAESSTVPDGTSEESRDDANPLVDIARQMFDHTRARFMDVIEKITKVMNDLFSPPPLPSRGSSEGEVNAATPGPMDPFEGKLRASFMLTVAVLLIVVVTRAQGARWP